MAIGDLILRGIAEVDPNTLQDFSCGSNSLDDFLKEEALLYNQNGLTRTTVAFLEGEISPVGYFSLSSDNLKLSQMEELELGLNFQIIVKAFPAVKITRLAVASNFQSRGIGRSLIEIIEGLVFTSSVATRLLTVDADNTDGAIRFYRRLNFVESLVHAGQRQNALGRRANIEPPATISMFKDIYAD